MSPSSDAALRHLRKIKPSDGWAIDRKAGSNRLVRLTRRNVAVTDSYFFDIYHDIATNQVVGILTGINGNGGGKVQAQVLVDSSGRLVGAKIALVSVANYTATAASQSRTSTATRSPAGAAPSRQSVPTLSDAQNRDLVKYGGAAIVAAIVVRLLRSALFGLSVLLLPAAYLYLVSTCPTAESFDAKKELKRTLRGHHLSEDHPDKPKGLLSETLARIQASVTTELATLPGYEVTIVPMAGACIVACTRVPSVQMDYYWVGAANKWWFVYGNPISNDGRAK